MTYAAPRSWSTDTASANGHLNASALNQDIRDNLISLRGLNDYSAKVLLSNDLSINSATETAVTWETSAWNIGSMWSSGVTPTRITVAVTGFYELCGTINFLSDSTGSRRVSYRVNGTTTHCLSNRPATDNGPTYVDYYDVVSLTAGDYVEILVFQDSGGALKVDSGPTASHACLTLLGDSNAATWTTPTTYQLGQGLTAAGLNTYLRDNVGTLRGMNGYAIKVTMAANLSIANASAAGPPWAVSQFSVGSGMWSSAVSASEITAPVTGWWSVFGRTRWALNTSGQRRIDLFAFDPVTNTTMLYFYDGTDAVTATGAAQSFSDVLYLSSGSKLRMRAYQESGGALNLISGATGSAFGCYLLGATA